MYYTFTFQPVELQEKSLYQVSEFRECLNDLHTLCLGAAEHPQQAIREKYKQDK